VTDILIDSMDQRATGLLNLFDRAPGDERETWTYEVAFEPTFGPDADRMVEGVVSAGSVEGIPLALVQAYTDIAVRHCFVRRIEGSWFATVAGIDGAWGDGGTPEEAVAELRAAIIGWVAVKRRVRAGDIPAMEGIDLNAPS
jgi:predicted RNase H-like HicB family nuclease